ncbi:MAG: type II secretion system F family protein [Actinomycetota bacterium]|nr:type II secretion system F family protein [Actinomycetota bacterium]
MATLCGAELRSARPASPSRRKRSTHFVIDIEELKPASAGDTLARFKKVKARDLTVATRQFSSMVSSGMSLLRSLYVLEEQVESEQLKEALVDIRGDVEAGISLSDALAKHPRIFNELYTAMVAAGETGGILDETLHRVADQLEKDDALRRQVRAAMMYPGSWAASRSWCCSRWSPSSCRSSRRCSRISGASCRRSPRSRSACPISSLLIGGTVLGI